MTTALLTDSTACLAPQWADEHGVAVVPLHVIVDGRNHVEGRDISAPEVATALRSKQRVTTSRPSPQALLAAYENLATQGADEIVSVHLSSELSGTVAAAQLAAAEASVPVTVVDSRTLGMAMGAAVLDGARAAATGAAADDVATVVERSCVAGSLRLYVDNLEYLRRGGRIGSAAALFGSALAIKPILGVIDGELALVEKVRTASRAMARLAELSVEAVSEVPAWADGVQIAVHHLDLAERAADLRDQLASQVDAPVRIVDLSAVIAAHVGPGAIAVAVSPVERT
ncbi:DegV family protein [Janibacter sp. GXQ6167]|uniref:DegV family protein n=1 Tax=Janibacter sp. GXQ6167 TaxID=3240791 RepID=UPI0035239828